MRGEKAFLGVGIAVADLAEHPANGLVHEVVLIVQQKLGEFERIGVVVFTDEVVGR